MMMMRLLIAFLLSALCGQAQECDILIRHAKIVDGTGNAWFYGDIAIKNGKILQTGQLQLKATKTIDATGLIAAPGFIDVHTHIEGDESKVPTADAFIHDGVTTVITGNCGISNIHLGEYFQQLDSLRLSINVGSLIGHNDVRKAVMGNTDRQPDLAEQREMEALVEKAMQDGCMGLSTGLIYLPGMYAREPEIAGLAKVAARYGGLYATHMRNENDSVEYAIREALSIGRQADIPVQISHFKVGGKQNWGRSRITLHMIEKARREGIDVTIDQYPYTASSTSLRSLMPEWALSGGDDSLQYRLRIPAIRKKMADEMVQRYRRRKVVNLDYAVVADFETDTGYNGKSITAITKLKGHSRPGLQQEAETILQMMSQGGAAMIFHGMSEEDVRRIMQYPFNMFASDAGIREFNKGMPHPRGYGTNARVLGKYVREEKVLGLEEAVRRMTSLPAQRFRLENRGLLLPGYAADIVLFDAEKVKDLSTYEKPHQYSTGFQYVLVNGRITLENGRHTGERNGKTLRKR